jgi:hypothetical protein
MLGTNSHASPVTELGDLTEQRIPWVECGMTRSCLTAEAAVTAYATLLLIQNALSAIIIQREV